MKKEKEVFKTISNDEYRKLSGLSASDLKLMMKSMAHYKYHIDNPEEGDTPAFLFGRAYHKLMLEPDDFGKEFVISPKFDRRTKEGKAAYEDFMKNAEGKDIIDVETFDKLKEMQRALYATPYVKFLINGEHEKSFFWEDVSGITCKCRPDSFGETKGNKICVDLKTTQNAETSAFMRDAIKFGYDIQAYHYCEGLKAAYGEEFKFLFIAQEKTAPYLVNVLEADEDFMRSGKILRTELIDKYKKALETDVWEGYINETDGINSLSVPAWLKQSMEYEDEESEGGFE